MQDDLLDPIATTVREDFAAERRILSFRGWLDLFLAAPYVHARSAPQYVADMFDHFGTVPVPGALGATARWRLFDLDFLDGAGRVHSQEVVQERVYRLVRTAADAGRADKLILLHGPNGSGKSVLVEAIFRGLERYSRTAEGALHRFNWVFARAAGETDVMGFHHPAAAETGSLAELPGEALHARLLCEMKDNPLFLVPAAERKALLDRALANAPADTERSFRHVLEGELCQKCKSIYEGLLAGYQGDWTKVVRHVQVERFYISQRYREGAVTIHPMGSADAHEQQITADLSVQNLPPVLQNLKIFEPYGDLVDAGAGVVEFGDFLKRPMEFNKYLLGAVEKGTISLPNSFLFLNLLMMGTSNEKHLDAFKNSPDFTSFKGRIELVPVPYILEYRREAELYRDMLGPVAERFHVAPHALETAALWAVLTRLIPADPEDLPGRLGEIAGGLTPLEKAFLYDRHEAPGRLSPEDRQILRGGASAVRRQYQDNIVYEGRFGASAREMRMVLSQAAMDRTSDCLTPSLVFARLRDLIRDKTVYDFLQIEPRQGYHDPAAFIDLVADHYALLVREEIQDAMELIREDEYDRRFAEYVRHVIAYNRGEKVKNPQTGALEPPSQRIMGAVEQLLEVRDAADRFRKDLVARIGAYALDHPEEKLDYRSLFPDLLQAVKSDFFRKREAAVGDLLADLNLLDTDGYHHLPDPQRALVDVAAANLERRHGYCRACIRDAAAFLAAREKEA